MNRKKSRITLLIPMVAIILFLGGAVTMKLNSSIFQTSNLNFKSEDEGIQILGDYLIYEILGTEACSCLGNTYSDDLPPEIVVMSPPNNSLIFTNTTIFIEASDNFPAMDGGIPFVPEYIYYHWNNATSNITIYDAGIDGAPPDNGPVKIELTLPNDEGNVTHELYIYAVDYENNWASLLLVYSTISEVSETSVISTTTTTTTTTTTANTTTEELSNSTTETTTTILTVPNLTAGFSAHIIIFLLMILVPIKRMKK